jgi:enoyl-[acyl-carrier protein] reductase I
MAHKLLEGKKGIIFGALNNMSIAWKVAERASEEGAQLVLTNTPIAMRFGEIDELAAKTKSIIIPADATSEKDIENLIAKTMDHFGGKFDFILHSIAMSMNVRKGRPYNDLNYDLLVKTLDISAMSFHKVLQIAYKLDAIKEWGSVVFIKIMIRSSAPALLNTFL